MIAMMTMHTVRSRMRVATIAGCLLAGATLAGAGKLPIPLKEAKLNIEHNATDHDTGFQGFIDSDGWKRLDVTGPDGAVLTFRGRGALADLGLTELFFETVEPGNVDVPIEELLGRLPEGSYTIAGPSMENGESAGRTEGVALLTHDIPAGPELLSPAAGATVPTTGVVASWSPVTKTITGDDVSIIAYQLIVEKDEPPHPHMIGKIGLSVYVPASITTSRSPTASCSRRRRTSGRCWRSRRAAIRRSPRASSSRSDGTRGRPAAHALCGAATATSRSRYQPGAEPDYGHRFHAGNVGDVWKHCVLVEVLRRAVTGAARVAYLDTHAGEGRYPLAATGEWTEGIGRVWNASPGDGDAVARYVALCRRLGAGTERPTRYPGSPLLARAVLGPEATMALWERDAAACDALRSMLGTDPTARLVCDDGLAALGDAVAAGEGEADAVVMLIDPPYTQKADWTTVPDALARALAGACRTSVLLWYPVKSLTRPNAMIARLAAAGVAGTIAELVTTPLDQQRRRLNGSGVLLVRPPDGALEAIAAAAPVLGAACATQVGRWSFRMLASR